MNPRSRGWLFFVILVVVAALAFVAGDLFRFVDGDSHVNNGVQSSGNLAVSADW